MQPAMDSSLHAARQWSDLFDFTALKGHTSPPGAAEAKSPSPFSSARSSRQTAAHRQLCCSKHRDVCSSFLVQKRPHHLEEATTLTFFISGLEAGKTNHQACLFCRPVLRGPSRIREVSRDLLLTLLLFTF